MTTIDRGLRDDLTLLANERTQRAPLGLVAYEPLMSMLKVERTPPPVFVDSLLLYPNEQTSRSALPVVSDRQRLAEARFRVELSQLVIGLEEKVAETNDPKVTAGFDEVCRFLMHSEHLRILQQN